jgi:hypothetical protein
MSSFSERAAFGALVLVLSLAAPGRAWADPSPADVESAKGQYLEGMTLREKGDEAGALVRFRAAFALVPTPITALEVGRSQLALGKILDGRDTLVKAAHMPKVAGESPKADEARDEASRLADAAKSRLASLTVTPITGDDATLRIDGAAIPRDASTAPRIVDPGPHVIDVRARGSEGHVEITLAEGEQRVVEVPLHPSADAPGPLRIHPLVWIGFGVGALGILGGVGTGVGALVTAGTLADECPNKVCPPSSQATIDTSKALGITSTVAWAVGGAGLLAGFVGLALSRRAPATTAWARPTFTVSAAGASFGLEGRF